MMAGIQNLDSKIEDQMEKSLHNIEDVVDEIDDVTGDINELKGILSEALGGFPFKVGILLVLLYHLSYLFYKAFFETRIDHIIQDDCYCDQRDQAVYRAITLIFMGAWIIFLPGYAFYKSFNRFICATCSVCCCCGDKSEDHKKMKELFDKYIQEIEYLKEYFLKEVTDMITTYYLDSQHYKSKKEKLANVKRNTMRTLKEDNGCLGDIEVDEIDTKSNANIISCKKWCSCTKHCCFMLFKILFISVRFGFRLAIIPLLQLHWLNDYAWNCIFNNLLREYCATITNEYFIGLDHSLVVYAMYVFILSAILFSIIIDWFPRGIPSFILKFEGNLNSLTISVDRGKRQDNKRKK